MAITEGEAPPAFPSPSLRSLVKDHPGTGRRILVCLEPRARRTEDGIDILPAGNLVHSCGPADCRNPQVAG